MNLDFLLRLFPTVYVVIPDYVNVYPTLFFAVCVVSPDFVNVYRSLFPAVCVVNPDSLLRLFSAIRVVIPEFVIVYPPSSSPPSVWCTPTSSFVLGLRRELPQPRHQSLRRTRL